MSRQTFPSRMPIGLLLGGVLAVSSVVPCIRVWQARQDPLQAYYLRSYIRASVRLGPPKLESVLLLSQTAGSGQPCDSAKLLLATRTAPVIWEAVAAAGKCDVETTQLKLKEWLRVSVYDGQTCIELLRVPLIIWAGLALCCLIGGGVFEVHRKRSARDGIQVRGPEMVSRWEFNRRVAGDGFSIVLENPRNPLELMKGNVGKVLRIRRRDENKNIICMSDPGGGKTSIFMQILDEVQRRG